MNKSETISALAKAIVAAQPSIEKAFKKSENPYFKSNYADLTETWRSCEHALKDNKIAVLQPMRVNDNGDVIVETVLLHESGEWISGEVFIKPDKQTPQGVGSAITYARRYSLAAMVGVCPEDDDAEGAMNRGKDKEDEPQPKQITKKSDLINAIAETMKQIVEISTDVPAEEMGAYKVKILKSVFEEEDGVRLYSDPGQAWKQVQSFKNDYLKKGLSLLEEILDMRRKAN